MTYIKFFLDYQRGLNRIQGQEEEEGEEEGQEEEQGKEEEQDPKAQPWDSRDSGVVEQHGIIIKCIGTLGEILSSLYLHTGDGVRH